MSLTWICALVGAVCSRIFWELNWLDSGRVEITGWAISLGEDVPGGVMVLAMGESEIVPNSGESGPWNGGDLSLS